MQIKLTRNCFAKGKPRETGAVLDVSDEEGRYLVSINKAEAVEAKKKKKGKGGKADDGNDGNDGE